MGLPTPSLENVPEGVPPKWRFINVTAAQNERMHGLLRRFAAALSVLSTASRCNMMCMLCLHCSHTTLVLVPGTRPSSRKGATLQRQDEVS